MRCGALAVLLLIFMCASAPARGQGGARIFLPLLAQRPRSSVGTPIPIADFEGRGSGLSSFSRLARGDTLFFTRSNGELWVTKAFPSSTRQLCSPQVTIAPPCAPASNLTLVGDTVFFASYRSESEVALWRSDGTAEGTTLVRSFGPPVPQATSVVSRLAELRGLLYFFVVGTGDPRGPSAELWRSDGTALGTVRLRSIPLASAGWVARFGDRLYYQVSRGSQSELWVTDGTDAGTQLLLDNRPIYDITWTERRMWFASDGEPGYGLWVSDGTAAGTRRVRSFNDGPNNLIELRGKVFFALYMPVFVAWHDLWVSDGTTAGTVPIFEGEARYLTAHGDTLFFAGDGNLWRSDGTRAGTREVAATPSTIGPPFSGGRYLFFDGAAEGVGSELWVSDGTAAGTRLLHDINPGPGSSHPRDFILVGDIMYFSADDGVHGRELWAVRIVP